MKIRLDKLLVDRALAQSRERAQALILAGRVLVNEQRIDKPGAPVPDDATLRMLGDDLRFVSRGGLKLEAALASWNLSVEGLACADIGASTGGLRIACCSTALRPSLRWTPAMARSRTSFVLIPA